MVGAAGVAAAAIDLRTRRVPNPLTLGIAVTGLALAASGLGVLHPAQALGGLAVGLALMLPGHLVGATGAGDVKLFAALGTLLGPAGMLWGFVYTAIAGGVLAVVVAWRRRVVAETVTRTATLIRTIGSNAAEIERPSVNNRFAYAPAIALGTLIAALGL